METIDNALLKFSQKVKKDEDLSKLKDKIYDILSNIGNIYSYIVYAKYNKNKFEHWSIQYNISQNECYNTLSPEQVAKDIADKIINYNENDKQYVIGYNQPPLDIMVKLYSPLVLKLALVQHERWQYLEIDDLYQMCMLSMCKLYNKGYYLHKDVLRKCFNNDVLMHIRKNKNSPIIISLDDIYFASGDNDGDIKVEDVIEDLDSTNDIVDIEELDAKESEYNDKRSVIIELIGDRQYDQLLREYGNKTTTNWSRKTVYRLKERLRKLGIDESMFIVHHMPAKGGKQK